MRKKIQFWIIMVLCLVMAASLPLTAYADEKETDYISDLQVVYASSYEDAKTQLAANGYTAVEQQLDQSEGVWIGYKTTTNKDEAITDVAVMNMNGGYSYDAFDKMLADKKKEIANYVSGLMTTVKEYKANYEANEPAAIYAHDVLNKLTEDDYDNQGMGDLLISDKAEEALNSICLESSALVIDSILTYLGIACVKDWIGDLIAEGEEQEYDAETAEKAQTIYTMLPSFYTNLTAYVNSGLSLSTQTEDEINAYFKDNPSNALNMASYGAAYEVLKATPYKDGTLLDVLYKDPEDIDVKDLCPIAAAMSDGLMEVISSVGLEKAIAFSGAGQEAIDETKANLGLDSAGTASVFDGVDRSIYEGEGVAMTSDAIRQYSSSSSGGTDLQKIDEIIFLVAGGAFCLAVLGYLTAIFVHMKYDLIFEAVAHNVLRTTTGVLMARKTIFIANTVATVLVVVAILVLITAIILKSLIKPKRGVEYTTIPRVIIDQRIVNDTEDMYAYKAVTDTTGKYADLHNWKGTEWLALYYTKNANAGNPLTPQMVISKNADEVTTDTCVPIHNFGTTASADLYAYHRSGDGALYIGFAAAGTSGANAAATSVSATWYAVSAAAGLLVGILATYFIGKASRKKKKAEA